MFYGEGTVQVNGQNAYLCTFRSIHQFCRLNRSFLTGTHNYYQIFRIFRAIVIEQVVFTAGDLAYLCHVFFYNFRNRFIIFIDSFAALEISIRILCSTPHNRFIRIQASLAEFLYRFPVQHVCIVFIIKHFNFLDFMGSTEPVKEVQERNPALYGSQMGHTRQVHNFLHTAFRQHGKAGLTAGHDVLMIAEDTQGAGSQRTGRYVEYRRQQLAGNFIHVRNHQQQALGCRIGRRHGACLQGSVYCPCRTGFRLHFQQFHSLSEQILFPCGSPFIYMFRHG